MGHNLLQQRRGRGVSVRFNAPSHRFYGKVKYRNFDDLERTGTVNGKIINLFDCPGHNAPLMQIKYENGDTILLVAPDNICLNQSITSGTNAEPKIGNVLPLKNIPKTESIFNIEINPGDGGKLVRSPGTFARIVASTPEKITLKLPSGKTKDFQPDCRATIGVICGAGRQDKPFVKAGKKYYAMKARNRVYPIVSPVKMNPIDHPFGCGRAKNMGRSAIPRRGAPPGAKVGLIRARRTGRRR